MFILYVYLLTFTSGGGDCLSVFVVVKPLDIIEETSLQLQAAFLATKTGILSQNMILC